MDLNTVTSVVEAPTRADQATWQPGDAWLGGGTWLFSEPQPALRRLLDLIGFGWPARWTWTRSRSGSATSSGPATRW